MSTIDRLAELAKRATQDGWEWEGRKVDDDGYVYIPQGSYLVGMICLADTYEGSAKDCDYIAACNPAAIAQVEAEYKALEAENERLRGALDDAAQLASEAMRQANNDGAEYDNRLAEARATISDYFAETLFYQTKGQ